jgi:hypothetical protein
MKRSVAAILATLVLGNAAFAADECEYVKDGLDPFTSEREVLTKWKTFTKWGNQAYSHGWMAGLQEHDKTFLALRIGLVGYRGQPTILEGGRLQILMADDSTVDLAAYQEVKLESWYVVVRYELTAETIEALKAQGTTGIRVSSANDEHHFKFGRKPTDRMQYVIGCLPPEAIKKAQEPA